MVNTAHAFKTTHGYYPSIELIQKVLNKLINTTQTVTHSKIYDLQQLACKGQWSTVKQKGPSWLQCKYPSHDGCM